MNIFEANDYRDFLRARLEASSGKSHGQLSRIAKALNIHPSIVTLVLQDKKNFTPEQGADLCEYFGLSDLEAETFLCLLSIARAGNNSLRSVLRKRLSGLHEKSQNLKERIPAKGELDESAKAVFYSEWYYSGLRNLSGLGTFHSADAFAKRLGLPVSTAQRVLDFLLSSRLCIEQEGQITFGPQSTHLEKNSMFIQRHHANWRLRAIELMNNKNADDLNFTSPLSISEQDFHVVKHLLQDAIEKCFSIIDPSPSETVAFLNVDWMKY